MGQALCRAGSAGEEYPEPGAYYSAKRTEAAGTERESKAPTGKHLSKSSVTINFSK